MSHWESFDGREIEQVTFEEGSPLTPFDDFKIICRVQYMGDRTEVWFALVQNGVEISRYNPRYVFSVTWAKP